MYTHNYFYKAVAELNEPDLIETDLFVELFIYTSPCSDWPAVSVLLHFLTAQMIPTTIRTTPTILPMTMPAMAPGLSPSVPAGHSADPLETHLTVYSSFMKDTEKPLTVKSVSVALLSWLNRSRAPA